MNTPKSTRRAAAVIEYVVTMTFIVLCVAIVAQVGRKVFSPVNQLAYDAAQIELDGQVESSSSQHDQTAVLLAVAIVCGLTILAKFRTRSRTPDFDEECEDFPEISNEESTLRALLFLKRNTVLGEMTNDLRRVLESRVEVRHLMTTDSKVVPPEETASNVRLLMRKNKLHHLLVCDGERLIGVISDRDLGSVSHNTANEMMTRNPITVFPNTLLIPAITSMINNRISCLPVTDNGKLVGVLTRTDLLIAFQCVLQIHAKNDRKAIAIER